MRMIEQFATVDRVHLEASELAEFAVFAGELADLAAAKILPYFRTPVAVENKVTQSSFISCDGSSSLTAEFDPVTVADKSAEAVIRKKIRETYPGHGIFGEEHGVYIGDTGLTWVLDPIDGTRAFITGLPLWGCLIALFDGVEPVLGVMDQPYLSERYVGTCDAAHYIGRGSLAGPGVNQPTAMKTRSCKQLANAVMMTTSPDMFKTDTEQKGFSQLARKVRMHRFGGDCYAYCMLAQGFVDLVVEADLQPYDIQALIPIVQGAGGVITDWQGNSAKAGGQVIAAATGELHARALAELVS